jgi:hypothetical protein
MRIISHRGNLNGPDKETENSPEQIDKVIAAGFDVEIDLWYNKNNYFLGHDGPDYEINIVWLTERASQLWIHCKNGLALEKMSATKNLNYFWHQGDEYTLTSKKYAWVYPGKKLLLNSVCVLPEIKFIDGFLDDCYAICTDYPESYKEKFV